MLCEVLINCVRKFGLTKESNHYTVVKIELFIIVKSLTYIGYFMISLYNSKVCKKGKNMLGLVSTLDNKKGSNWIFIYYLN